MGWAFLSLLKLQLKKAIFDTKPVEKKWTQKRSSEREIHIEEVKLKRSRVTVTVHFVESTRTDQLKRYGMILHDFPDSPRTWSSVLERLNPDFSFIVPNLNVKTANPVTLCLELIDKLCEQQSVFLIGSGMGAILAWSMLQIRPNLATKVVIISEGYQTSLRRLNSAEVLIKSGLISLLQIENYHLLRRYLEKRQINAAELEDIISDISLKNDLGDRMCYWRQVDQLRYTSTKSKIQSPVRALLGSTDPDRKNIMSSLIDSTTVLTLMETKGTHFLHAHSPKKIAAHINNFIQVQLLVPSVRFRFASG